jgi:hypothetical protein
LAKPYKKGLDYFPLDVDMDDKMELIEAKYGVIGFGTVIKMYQKIYKEGYFYPWEERQQLLFAKKINQELENVLSVIDDCLKWGVFNNDLYKK